MPGVRILACLVLLALPASASALAEDTAIECLTSGDAAEVVASRRVIAPHDAMVAARHAIQSGDILRASLCRKEDGFVYRLTAIRPDGRVVRVTIDAPSGKVRNLH